MTEPIVRIVEVFGAELPSNLLGVNDVLAAVLSTTGTTDFEVDLDAAFKFRLGTGIAEGNTLSTDTGLSPRRRAVNAVDCGIWLGIALDFGNAFLIVWGGYVLELGAIS